MTERARPVADDVKVMDEHTLQDLLDRHDLGDAEGRDIDGLRAVVQEAYMIGWTERENQPALRKQQFEELLRDDERLQAALDRLTPEERSVVELRFGPADENTGRQPLLAKVSRKLGVSKDRVRELERSAVRKMLAEQPEE
jgi:DNA-directed RNA polymerase specialized sigma subunit